MPWIVGIDEAGYGPNLGPFVMTSVCCHYGKIRDRTDLWKVFKPVARRHDEPNDSRFVVADSKLVYSPARGIVSLEHTVHAATNAADAGTLAVLLNRLCPDCHDDIRREVWYHGSTAIPVHADRALCNEATQALGGLCEQLNIRFGPIRSVVVCPGEFNALLDRWDSKGAVLGLALVRLLRALPDDQEPVFINIDKHGGRNYYAAMLQHAFDNGLVLADTEGAECSRYRVMDGNRHVEVTIEPRADTNHFCVALASMVSKYLRELLMMEFNLFWNAKIPNLEPTAGYPMDAKRFWGDIQGAARSLGIADDALWRRK